MKPSKYQQAIFDFISTSSGSAVIQAVAGSGKTTTIIKSLELIPTHKKAIFLAFNKSIATELQKRVPEVDVKTLNSLGHSMWWNFRNRGAIKLNTYKNRDILRNKLGFDDAKLIRKLEPLLLKLVSVAKAAGLVPNPKLTGILADTLENWEVLINHYDLSFTDTELSFAIKTARHVLEIGLDMLDEIDFDDQMYMSVAYQAKPFRQYDFVFVDESQDVSDIQREMLTRIIHKKSRIIAVGDRSQCIYGFRGSNTESIENFIKQFNAVELPLSISYRCPKSVVREAQMYVPHIESSETAIEGVVESLGSYEPNFFKEKDLVVCRNTAPLIRLAYTLITARIPVTVMGRDLGAGLIKLIESLNPHSIDNLCDKLSEWVKKEEKKLLRKDPNANIERLHDKYDAMYTFIECSGAKSISQLISCINNLFSSEQGGVLLSTIHRAKGLEAKTVFILDSYLIPSKYATQPWQHQQEMNLMYVAITRAQERLCYISSPAK